MEYYPYLNVYLFNVNKRNSRKGEEICSNNKDTRTMPIAYLTYSLPFSNVFVFNFDKVNIYWVLLSTEQTEDGNNSLFLKMKIFLEKIKAGFVVSKIKTFMI